jgi:molecular chaperone DnaK
MILSFFLTELLKTHELYRLIHSVGKNLTEHGDKLDDATKAEIQKAIDDAKKFESNTDVEAIKAQSQALSNASMKIGQAMYKKDGATSETPSNPEPETENAQYEEKGKK